ncbi:hypothetical protein Cflav_PD0143 [Pedosphaera parvula Ellin514]|uniref:Uncharacterized protein n=1 Tax=Pedosphaera parvula (strain Ellin514) TaxID=320771 RepID=B9XSL7_PEDPL|nr:hypothetical protein Cflav_PD0143 [Pedosphaera parvula Ellin514]
MARFLIFTTRGTTYTLKPGRFLGQKTSHSLKICFKDTGLLNPAGPPNYQV